MGGDSRAVARGLRRGLGLYFGNSKKSLEGFRQRSEMMRLNFERFTVPAVWRGISIGQESWWDRQASNEGPGAGWLLGVEGPEALSSPLCVCRLPPAGHFQAGVRLLTRPSRPEKGDQRETRPFYLPPPGRQAEREILL